MDGRRSNAKLVLRTVLDRSVSDALAFGVSGAKFLRLHPIYKALRSENRGGVIVSSSSGNRKRKNWNSTEGDDVRLNVNDDEMCMARVASKNTSKSCKIGNELRAEEMESEVGYKYGRCNGAVEEEIKLDSGKFESLLEKMWGRFSKEQINGLAYIDSLWFSSYTKGRLKEKVLRWIREKDIFSNKYVFIPIVLWGHWSLLICCHFGESHVSLKRSRCMLLLDSLQSVNCGGIESAIRRFVFDILKSEREDDEEEKDRIVNIPLLIPKVPQQESRVACGSFVLYYIYQFIQRAPIEFSVSNGYPYFLTKDWFSREDVESFLKEMMSLPE